MKKLFLFLMALCLSIVIQAQISKTITDLTPGGLFNKMSTIELYTVTNLILSGTIDGRDFKTMNEMLKLSVIDLTGVNIAEYTETGGASYSKNSVPESAFVNNVRLTSVTLPSSITSIEGSAFNSCSNLISINIPSSVTTIKNAAFYICKSLASVKIPASVIDIGNWAFSQSSAKVTVDSENPNYSSIDDVLFDKAQTVLIHCPTTKSGNYIIPASVKIVKEDAFNMCKKLTSVILPNSVTKIGYDAFSECIGLTSVTMGNSLDSIAERAFMSCVNLPNITLPNSVTYIGYAAFASCISLTSVNIPASVPFLEDMVFRFCNKLKSIYAYSTTPPVLPFDLVFDGVDKKTCTLYVPAGSKDLYKTASIWKDFTKIETFITSTDKEIKTELVVVWPNPAKDLLTISAKKGFVSIYNSNGKLEITQLLEINRVVNISSLTSGMYLVVVNGMGYKIMKD